MNENVLTDVREKSPIAVPGAFQTIFWGWLAVGILDGLSAIITSLVLGGSPIRMFKAIASSLLGRETAMAGGAETILLGVVLHFCVAFGVVAVLYLIVRRMPVLPRYPYIVGPIYGIAVYFMMNYVVLPQTLIQQGPFDLTSMIRGIIIHILFVGLPPMLIASYLSRKEQAG
jgi:hypothetical protein